MGLNFNKDIQEIIGVARDRRHIREVHGDRVTHIKRKTILEGYGVAHKFNDFRDYYVQYILYLPFCNSIVLETPKILGKVLSIECYLDIRTAQGKYYIMADKTLISTASFECRINMPITSTNPVQQAIDKAQGIYDTVQGVGGLMKGFQAASPLGKLQDVKGKIDKSNLDALGSVAGVVSGSPEVGALGSMFANQIGDVIPTNNGSPKEQIMTGLGKTALGLFEMFKPSPISVNGSASGSTCVDDPLSIYLYTLIPDIHYNEPLKNNYGIPNNVYDKIGNHKGYVEINDLKLHGNIAERYKSDIISMLKTGIYII